METPEIPMTFARLSDIAKELADCKRDALDCSLRTADELFQEVKRLRFEQREVRLRMLFMQRDALVCVYRS